MDLCLRLFVIQNYWGGGGEYDHLLLIVMTTIRRYDEVKENDLYMEFKGTVHFW